MSPVSQFSISADDGSSIDPKAPDSKILSVAVIKSLQIIVSPKMFSKLAEVMTCSYVTLKVNRTPSSLYLDLDG
ncbi:hypothetical protein M514_11221 [Trichuris suis]|uniref:Uncharacterized protein n=1 Tax=Trichuris suis TaxID=68888 RepID=A0A085LSI4_9BILA|nr:hypothetical protein M513_11221 [Trichuris suis]KFD68001.1 hypothetical protein M514_11221 [Trichuris suis]